MEELFFAEYTDTEYPSNENFRLTSHDFYEIYIFIEGDTKYIVEENSYNLSPYDIVIIRKNVMHKAYHNSYKRYKRIVLYVYPEFFTKNNCTEYEAFFFNPGIGNKIEAKNVMESGLYNALNRLLKYTDDFKNTDTPIGTSMVIEILYLLGQMNSFATANNTDKSLNAIIEYINEHFTENITLEALCERFYISVYHLCRKFKKATGLTIHEYITKKRLNYARELMKTHNISQAAEFAGFSSYTAFYRAYVSQYGKSPKYEIKNSGI